MNWSENLSLLTLNELSTLKDESATALSEVRQRITLLIHGRLSRTITRSDYSAEWKALKAKEAEFKRRVALLTREIGRRRILTRAQNSGSATGGTD